VVHKNVSKNRVSFRHIGEICRNHRHSGSMRDRVLEMIAWIEERREALEALYRRRRVRRLALFGSAARGDFAPGRSDLDFLAEFAPMEPGERADACFGLLFDLEALFGATVDLVERGAIRNPYVRRTIDQHQETVYAAA
jgi:uncharacterized protein